MIMHIVLEAYGTFNDQKCAMQLGQRDVWLKSFNGNLWISMEMRSLPPWIVVCLLCKRNAWPISHVATVAPITNLLPPPLPPMGSIYSMRKQSLHCSILPSICIQHLCQCTWSQKLLTQHIS